MRSGCPLTSAASSAKKKADEQGHTRGAAPEPGLQSVPRHAHELERIASRTLHKRPQDRYHSAEELARDLLVVKKSLEAPATGARTLAEVLRAPTVAIPAALAILVAAVRAVWTIKRNADVAAAAIKAFPVWCTCDRSPRPVDHRSRS